MKQFFIILFLAGIFNLNIGFARTITDMKGRTVEIPDKTERIFPYDAKTSILMFPLLQDKMTATATLPGKKNYKYISPGFTQLPEVDVKNIEEVLAASPQVIIASFYGKNDESSAIKLGERLNIPVVFISLALDELDKSYLFLGDLFNKKEESIVLANFLKNIYHTADSLKTKGISTKGEVYYTLGETGLMTDPSGSKHTQVFDYMNIPIAAKVPAPTGGHAKVNMEQVLIWNPGYIFTVPFRGQQSAYQTITTDTKWKNINAVKNKKVFVSPTQPMGYFDHPPSVNRIPGIIWLCEVFFNYPTDKTKENITGFYELFYQYKLTDVEYENLFQNK